MKGLPALLAKLNGWALSLALHGLVLGLAALSVFGVQASGGSGSGTGGGAAGGGGGPDSFEATMQSENIVSGEPVGDPAQYGHLTEEADLTVPTEEPPQPVLPFDVFAVGSTEPPAPQTPPVVADPLDSRPVRPPDAVAKLPAGSNQEGPGAESDSPAGTAKDSGTGGLGGSGGGTSGGEGSGQGSGVGDGNATEVYTPAPAYPSDARRRNIQGIVIVELVISSDGSCVAQKVVESSGCDSLDHAVTATVSHWKYRSAEIDHRPDQLTKRVRFVFKLGEKDR
jgi:protein TonB